jgi:hypothetical protein
MHVRGPAHVQIDARVSVSVSGSVCPHVLVHVHAHVQVHVHVRRRMLCLYACTILCLACGSGSELLYHKGRPARALVVINWGGCETLSLSLNDFPHQL